MTVRDLIEQLGRLDDGLPVICYREQDDEPGATQSNLFDIDEVTMSRAITERRADGTPTIKFAKGEGSRNIAILAITAQF